MTMRLLLCMAMSRNWGITLGDVSTAFLHAAMSGEVYVWPPKEFYPNGDCLWRLKKAMYGLRQAPKLWQEHVMTSKLGFRRCKSDLPAVESVWAITLSFFASFARNSLDNSHRTSRRNLLGILHSIQIQNRTNVCL